MIWVFGWVCERVVGEVVGGCGWVPRCERSICRLRASLLWVSMGSPPSESLLMILAVALSRSSTLVNFKPFLRLVR